MSGMDEFDGYDDDGYDPDADDDDICIDCKAIGWEMDECSCCGATMCSACYEMGAGVCKGPHK